MTSFTFSIPTQIQFGPGSSRQAGLTVAQFLPIHKPGVKPHVLIIIDPGVRSASWLADILDSIEAAGLQCHLFYDVQPNPKDTDVEAAAALARTEKAGALVAIGGGSTMDTAKGCALLATYGRQASDYSGWGKVPGPVLPVVAIPTTAGSGSEATCWAVITDTSSHQKLAIGDRNLSPAAALVDPLLTLSLPPQLTAATGMDALTHSIEAYTGALSNPVNDLLALESIRLVATHLLQAVQDDQNLEAREGMMLASTLGGIAINSADVAGVHCLSEGMGSLYDAPHGMLNAILLPYFMAYWQAGCQDRFLRIAQAFGKGARPEEAVEQVQELSRSLGIPSLPEVGVKEADFPRLAAWAEANVSNASNPVPMAAADYLRILKLACEDQSP
jgi:alcohol dehydrogenase